MDLDCLSAADRCAIVALRGEVRRGDRVLLCLEQPEDDELFVREVDGRYFASHFAGGRPGSHGAHEIVAETDEHQRQREYWYRAGQDAEFSSERSFRTSAGNVLDVAIHGRTRTGVQLEHSRLTAAVAHQRTTRAGRAGWLSLWFTAADRVPKWFHRVPSVGCNHIAWDALPPRGTAQATGLKKVQAVKCTVHDFGGKCPAGKHRPCGRFHPQFVAWHQVTLDKVAYFVPSGRAVPLLTPRREVVLVPPEGLALYESLTGRSARYAAEKFSHSAVRCEQCDNALLWIRPGRVRCEQCDPIMNLPRSPYPL